MVSASGLVSLAVMNLKVMAMTESIAVTPVIYLTVSGKRELNMTHEQFDREKRYQVALSIAKSMLRKGVIDVDDYKDIDTRLMKKYHPILEGLCPNLA